MPLRPSTRSVATNTRTPGGSVSTRPSMRRPIASTSRATRSSSASSGIRTTTPPAQNLDPPGCPRRRQRDRHELRARPGCEALLPVRQSLRRDPPPPREAAALSTLDAGAPSRGLTRLGLPPLAAKSGQRRSVSCPSVPLPSRAYPCAAPQRGRTSVADGLPPFSSSPPPSSSSPVTAHRPHPSTPLPSPPAAAPDSHYANPDCIRPDRPPRRDSPPPATLRRSLRPRARPSRRPRDPLTYLRSPSTTQIPPAAK